MKYLKFKRCPDGHYIVIGQNNVALGVIQLKGEIFKRSIVSREFEPDTEMTAECHRQLADFMDSLKGNKNAK